MNEMNLRSKWSGPRMQERQKLASERRTILKESSTIKRRTLELAIARKVVDPKFLELEPELAQSSWVAYGYLSPVERTERFCKAYLECYRRYYEKYRNKDAAEGQKPIDPELFKNDPNEINSFWHARQMADEIGMPYNMYLNAVMEWATIQRNRKHFPRPNQLYCQQQIDVAIEKWKREQCSVQLFSEDWDDRFFLQNPVRDPPRKEALKLAITKMMNSGAPEHTLANLMGIWGALSEREAKHMAITLFPHRPELFDDAKRRMMSPLTRTATTIDPYLPPCVGMRQDITTEPCRQCSFTVLCQKARLVSDSLLQAQTGSSDPIANRRREQDRDRQRRKRDRDRAARSELEPAIAAS